MKILSFVVKWSDDILVQMASNYYGVFPLHQVTRYFYKEKIPVQQPLNIKHYNTNMEDVDTSDQNISVHRISSRRRKCYFSLVTHLFGASEQYSWQLYRKQVRNLDHLAFRRNIALPKIHMNKEDKDSN